MQPPAQPMVAVTVLPLASDHAISHNNTHALVTKMRNILPWSTDVPAGGGAATDSVLPLHRALILVARCKFNKDEANTLTTLLQHTLLDLGLDGPAWDRVVHELFDSGLGEFDFETEDELLDALAALVIKNPDNLVLSHADFLFGESFDTPAVASIPAGRARGRGRARGAAAPVPAVPAVPGLAALNFIALARLVDFQKDQDKLPLLALYKTRRVLGETMTRPARLDPMGLVSLAAGVIRPNLERRLTRRRKSQNSGCLPHT